MTEKPDFAKIQKLRDAYKAIQSIEDLISDADFESWNDLQDIKEILFTKLSILETNLINKTKL
jgi:enolase